MTKKMLIDAAQNEEIRVALIEGKKVEDFDFESSSRKPLRGNIYLARVTRVEPSLQAAFVEYGGNRHGFLAFSEIHPDYYQIPVSDRQLLQQAEQEIADIADELERYQRGDEDESDDTASSASGESGEEDDETVRFHGTDGEVEEPESNDDGDVNAPAETQEAEDATPEVDDAPTLGSLEDAGDEEEIVAPETVAPETVATATGEASDDDDIDGAGTDADRADAHEDDGDSVAVALAADGNPEITIGDEDFENDGENNAQRQKIADLNEQYKEARRKHARLVRNYKIQEVIKARQILLVQVVKEERGTKGAALTSYLSLAGRYCVLMPNTARGGGISRKIPSATDRKRLRRIVNSLDVTRGMGLIIRTAGAKRTKTEIKRDYDYLTRLWENIRELTLKSVAPCLIYEEASLIKRAIRDLYDKDITRVLVEGEEGYREAKDFMKMLMPSHAKYVQPYKENTPLFLHFDVEQQLDAMYQPAVRLKSGGYLVIHQTEALIAVDVNSGKATRERNIEATALKTNLEAASEVARQCKLRDLAGLIVIDFIDMEESRNNRAVEKRLKEALKNDRARIQTGRISGFGLLEMSRQRRRSGIVDGTTSACPTCSGSGAVRSHEMAALRIIRGIEAEAISNRAAVIAAKTSMEVALYILNHKRASLNRIEEHYALSIEITSDPSKAGDLYDIERRGAPRAMPERPAAVQADDGIEDDDTLSADTDDLTADEDNAERDHEDLEDGDGRKRRRRRRRRRGGRDQQDRAEGSSHDQPQDEQGSYEIAATGDRDGSGDDQRADEGVDNSENSDRPRKRRRRGRRGGRRNRSSDEASTEALEGADASAPETKDASAEGASQDAPLKEEAAEAADVTKPSDDGSGASDEKPKRRRRSRSSSKPAASNGKADEPAPSPESSPEPSPGPSPEPAPEPMAADPAPQLAPQAAPQPAPKPVATPPADTPKKSKSKKGWWQRALGG
ncbi:MAG: Rne/Rng family ribonuclease [Pseudomonadota bacterium]